LRVAQDKAGKAIGTEREDFYIPGTTDVQLLLQIIVIKKPTEEELSLLKSGLGDKVKLTSRIIFNETLPLRSTFTREIFDEEAVNITATQNAGIQRKVVKTMAEQAAISVRDMILYAF
jgi:glucose-6-phosphate-specific signal transduction histidine kinase